MTASRPRPTTLLRHALGLAGAALLACGLTGWPLAGHAAYLASVDADAIGTIQWAMDGGLQDVQFLGGRFENIDKAESTDPAKTASASLALQDTLLFAGHSFRSFAATSVRVTGPGGLHMSAASSAALHNLKAHTVNFSVEVHTGSTAWVQDDISVNLSHLPRGTPVLLEVPFRLDGALTSDFNEPATDIDYNYIDAYSGGFARLEVYSYGSGRPDGLPADVVSSVQRDFGLSLDRYGRIGRQDGFGGGVMKTYVLNGLPNTIVMTMGVGSRAEAWVHSPGPGYGVYEADLYARSQADLGHTFAWGGITSARLLDGTEIPLSELNIGSSSGFDYRNAYVATVPEPETALLWAAGCLGLLPLLRRRSIAARG